MYIESNSTFRWEKNNKSKKWEIVFDKIVLKSDEYDKNLKDENTLFFLYIMIAFFINLVAFISFCCFPFILEMKYSKEGTFIFVILYLNLNIFEIYDLKCNIEFFISHLYQFIKYV